MDNCTVSHTSKQGSPQIQSSSELPLQTAEEIAVWFEGTDLSQGRTIIDVTFRPARRFTALVSLSDGMTLFLKHISVDEASKRGYREVDFFHLIGSREELAPFRQMMPAFYYYDESCRMLVTEGLLNYETLREYCQVHLTVDNAILVRLGLHLAVCHSTSINSDISTEDKSRLHLYPPVPTYGHVTPRAFAHATGREYRIYLAVVQSINESLRVLKERWTPRCLIHGDFKDDNIMFCLEPKLEGQSSVKFVDWELAGWGDPLWDVGSLIGQFVLYWIRSIKPTSGENFLSWIRNTTVPFEAIRSSIANFLISYIHYSNMTPQEAERQYTKIVQYAGLFLLHRAQASLVVSGSLTPHAFCCLHIGKTLINDPHRSMKVLFSDLLFEDTAT